MVALAHLGRSLGRDEPAAREEPQHTGTHRALHGGDVRRTQQPSFVKLHPFPVGTEDTLDDRGSNPKGEIQGKIDLVA